MAFIVLPLVAAVTAALIFQVVYYEPDSGARTVVTSGLPLPLRVGAGAAIVSVPLTATGAASLVALLVWARVRVRLHHALAAGAIIGNAPLMVLALLVWLHSPPDHFSGAAMFNPAFVRTVAFGSATGIACAAAFWSLAGSSARQALGHSGG